MKTRNNLALQTVALVLSVGLAQTALAETVSYDASFTVDTTTGSKDSMVTVNASQFDTTLGTLTGITYGITGNANAVLAVFNPGAQTTFTGGSTSVPFSFSGAGISGSTPNLVISGVSGTAIGGETTYFPGSTSSLSFSGQVGAANWSSYEGSGTTGLLLGFGIGTSNGSPAPGSQIFVGTGGQAIGSVDITYAYTPVPLPAAAWLLISGLGGFGALTRRRRLS